MKLNRQPLVLLFVFFLSEEDYFHRMTNVGTGHWIFAGLFALAFLIFMIISYRKDLARTKMHYRRIWIIIILAVVVYFTIFFLNKYT